MTTIACDLKSMAGDGRATAGTMITDEQARKIHRLADGRIIGCAGNAADAQAFVEWLRDGGKFPVAKNLSALVLEPGGRLFYYEGTATPTPCLEPQAIGSGAAHALTAMDCGLSPREAVKMAAKRDSATGGRITVYELGA